MTMKSRPPHCQQTNLSISVTLPFPFKGTAEQKKHTHKLRHTHNRTTTHINHEGIRY